MAPSIPECRKVFLEELGIRCVEIGEVPSNYEDVQRLQREASAHRKVEQVEAEISSFLDHVEMIRSEDLAPSVTRKSLAISHRVLKDSLPGIRNSFEEYDVLPIKMVRTDSPDVICTTAPANLDCALHFAQGGAWWAYA